MSRDETGRYITTTIAGESVRAFVPDPLPPKLSKNDFATLDGPTQDAEAAIARLRLAGEMLPSLDWFIYSFVRKEALLSSEIEGTQATLTDVLSYEQTGQPGNAEIADVEEVTNYIKAINFGFGEIKSEEGLPISTRLLDQCHRRLMQGVRGANRQPGEARRSNVWIGGTRPGNSVFVPSPHQDVPALMDDLQRYIHADDAMHPLLRTAAVHLQLETIHPYLDGNGRVGRMLISLLLAHWDILPSPLLYLSVYLKENQQDYYAWLNKVRTEGEWIGWFQFFLRGTSTVASSAEQTARALYSQVTQDRKKLLAEDSTTVFAIKLFEMLPEQPIVTMPLVTKLMQTTKPTAGKAIDLLQQLGILAEVGEKKRDRLYSYKPYLALLS